MRSITRCGAATLLAFAASACTITAPDQPTPPAVTIYTADPRATEFGATGSEILANPELQPKLAALYGRDWFAGTENALAAPAPAFFSQAATLHVIRMARADYVALRGCRSGACPRDSGLLLIRADGNELLSRLDEGGYSHYYGFGTAVEMDPETRTWLDTAWQALRPGA